MEKDLILTVDVRRSTVARETAKSEAKKLAHKLMRPIEWLGNYYGRILEKPINRSQTLRLIEAQVAFAFSVLPVDCHLLLHGIFIGWFVWSVWKCKKAGI